MNETRNRISAALGWWVGRMQSSAVWVVALAAIAGVGLVRYTTTHLSVDTDTGNMLSPELQWRKAEHELSRLFPNSPLLVVVDGDSPELADDAENRLVERLRAQHDLFPEVFAAE